MDRLLMVAIWIILFIVGFNFMDFTINDEEISEEDENSKKNLP